MNSRMAVTLAVFGCAAFISSLALAGNNAAAGAAAESMPMGEGEKGPPPAQAEPFWMYISKTNPYLQWELWPGYDGIYPGMSPHGAYLKLYANDIAIEAARAGRRDMPYGAILVKENYGADRKTLLAITPMYKVKDYNPEAGDWYWTKYGPDGTVQAEGKVEGCINCHRSAMTRDWLFTVPK